jgi:hypothetical protein
VDIVSNTGFLLLAIWLILTGLLQVLAAPFLSIGTLLAILAVVAGIFILIGR